MSFGYLGKRKFLWGVATLTVATGAGTTAVTFGTSFVRTPSITVIPHESDAGTYSVKSSPAADEDGFTIDLVSSDYADGDIEVTWIAVEKD